MSSKSSSPLPRVGIALAAYRPEVATFAEQLATIASQTYSSWFCILTCDSPLGPLRREEALRPFFEDDRFVWHENQQRQGVTGNFMRAATLCVEGGAQFLAFADQDDVWFPQKVERLVQCLAQKPPLSVVHADMDVLHEGKRLVQSAWEMERRAVTRTDPSSLLILNVVTGASMMMDAALLRKYPIPAGSQMLHDHWFALCASHEGGVYPLLERLHAYRQHGNNVIGLRPYRGFLDGMSLADMRAKRHEPLANFAIRVEMLEALRSAGLAIDVELERLFLARDWGLSLLRYGWKARSDRALFRECFPLAYGKVMSR